MVAPGCGLDEAVRSDRASPGFTVGRREAGARAMGPGIRASLPRKIMRDAEGSGERPSLDDALP